MNETTQRPISNRGWQRRRRLSARLLRPPARPRHTLPLSTAFPLLYRRHLPTPQELESSRRRDVDEERGAWLGAVL
jgi:hypothetical protein